MWADASDKVRRHVEHIQAILSFPVQVGWSFAKLWLCVCCGMKHRGGVVRGRQLELPRPNGELHLTLQASSTLPAHRDRKSDLSGW